MDELGNEARRAVVDPREFDLMDRLQSICRKAQELIEKLARAPQHDDRPGEDEWSLNTASRGNQ